MWNIYIISKCKKKQIENISYQNPVKKQKIVSSTETPLSTFLLT